MPRTKECLVVGTVVVHHADGCRHVDDVTVRIVEQILPRIFTTVAVHVLELVLDVGWRIVLLWVLIGLLDSALIGTDSHELFTTSSVGSLEELEVLGLLRGCVFRA